MLIESFIQSQKFKRLPSFIKEHGIFSQIKKIEKPFPLIGLKNTLESFEPNFLDKDQNKKYYIGFSSTGINGSWDIATMSMRGVSSCMHWTNRHSKHLIGSITDSFLGIIYITDNEMTKYGISFRKRALVRLVYNSTSKQIAILLERTYRDSGNTNPEVYNNRELPGANTHQLFIDYLKSKIPDYIKIYDRVYISNCCDLKSFKNESMQYMDSSYHSMSDSGLSPYYDQYNYKFTDDPFQKEINELVQKCQVQI